MVVETLLFLVLKHADTSTQTCSAAGQTESVFLSCLISENTGRVRISYQENILPA